PWKASVVHARSWSDKHDDLRSKVLETWKSLLLSAGSLTKVGVSLLKAQEIPDAEARVMQIVNDVFLCKSTATLQARASALLHYVRWRNSAGLDPAAFPVDEEDAYEYVCFLRSEGAPKSEAVNFAGALLGFDFSQVKESSRIHEVAMSASFKPVSKCDPLTVAQVHALEEAIFKADLEEACVIGFVLYVLHGRLRWSDAQCTEAEPEIDLNEGIGLRSGCGAGNLRVSERAGVSKCEASSDLEPPSEVFSEAPEMEAADDFEVMAAVDSEALFKAKCKQLKLPEEAVTKMAAKGWTTYGTFAFAVPGDPGKISNSDFRSIVCQPVLGSEQEHVPKLRRLHFEAFAITAAELKRTAEVQESDQPRKLPVVELALVNQAAHMLEEQRIKYVEWFQCTSRAQEVNAVKEDSSLKLLQSSKEGAVLLRDPESGLKASTGSDLEVMQALRRRGLAYDLAAIMSFAAHEKPIDTLFAEYQRDVMPGHHPVSFSQMQMVAKAKARGTAAGEEETKPPAKKKRKVFYRVPKGLFGGVAKDNNGRALCFDHNLGLATDHTFLNHPA
ncbi:unnamed protein product, partial [Symbiodinium pilosum]